MVTEINLKIIIGILIVVIFILIFLTTFFYTKYKNKECIIRQYVRRECDPLTEVYDCSVDKKCVNYQCVPK